MDDERIPIIIMQYDEGWIVATLFGEVQPEGNA